MSLAGRHVEEVPHLADHAAHRGRVLANDLVAQPPEPESADRRLLVLRRADAALRQPKLDRREVAALGAVLGGLRFRRAHAFSVGAAAGGSDAPRPRRRAISSPLRRRRSPSNVALMTLCG